MAEAIDRPQSSGQVPADAGMSGEERIALAPVSSETYQPLSLLALAGFGLAIVYSFLVLVGGAISLLSRIPWLMPGWTFLLPIAILILCWAARTRIHNSEGTLSGSAFTTWGSRLAILFGLTYAAYYGFTFFAVRLQAVDFANRFFEQIKQGHPDQAYLMAQGISTKDKDSNELRNKLELQFNQPTAMPGMAGMYTHFRQEKFVRFIEMDGEKANITPRGVADWAYSKGGYRLVLDYHVSTSLVEFDMKLETFGRDPKPDEPKGLKWQILLNRGENVIMDSINLTTRGREFMQKAVKAHNFASDWSANVSDPSALNSNERENYSKLIRIDDKTFWAGKQQRADIIQCIHKTFQPAPAGKPAFSLNVQSVGATPPLLHESAGRTTASFDMTVRYFDESGIKQLYVVNGRLVVSAESSAAGNSASAWRIDALEFESGRTPPDRRRPTDPRAAGSASP